MDIDPREIPDGYRVPATIWVIGQAPLTTITSGGRSYKTIAEGMPTPIETETWFRSMRCAVGRCWLK